MLQTDIKTIASLSQEYKSEMIATFKENFAEVVNGREELRQDVSIHDIEVFFQEWLDIPEQDYQVPEEADFTGVTNDR